MTRGPLGPAASSCCVRWDMPQDDWRELYSRTVRDNYATRWSETNMPQGHKIVGDKYSTDVKRQIHCFGENVPQDVWR